MTQEIQETIKKAEDGNINLLDALLELRLKKHSLEQSLKDIKNFENKYIQDIALQAEEYHDGYKGFDVKLVNGRQTYNFKGIKEWVDADKGKKELEKKYKSLYAVYQNTKELPMSEDGVVYDLPEVNYGASYLKVTERK